MVKISGLLESFHSIAAGKVQGQFDVGPVTGYGSNVISIVYDMQATGFSTGADLERKATWELTTGSAVAGLGGSWTYKSGYYPRPKTLETIARDGIRTAAAFAASPIYLNEGDSAADVKHSFKVPTRTADDTPITWTATPADMADINPATGDVLLRYIGTLTLTGRSGAHSKTYALTVTNINSPTEYRVVSFNSDGGSYTPASQSVGVGQKVKEPTLPTKDGYVFAGWYWNTRMWDFNNDTVTENMTLTALWREPGQPAAYYTVTFNSVGGSSVPSQSVAAGGRVSRPANPTRSGYTFDGWYRDSTYNSPWDFNTAVAGSMTLYAKWKQNSSVTRYTVTFDPLNGEDVIRLTNVPYGSTISRPSNPELEGYTFYGWYRDLNYSRAWDFSTDVVTENTTLYAGWAEDDPYLDDGKDSFGGGGGCATGSAGLIAMAALAWFACGRRYKK